MVSKLYTLIKATALILAVIVIAFVLTNCNKNSDQPNVHINCDGLITDTLGTNDTGRVYMPNAFTPDNNDGKNDYLIPYARGIKSIYFTLYDENNKIVFTTTELRKGWHPSGGTAASVKYYYKIQAVTTANRKIGLCGEAYRLTCFPKNILRSNLRFPDQFTLTDFNGVSSETMDSCP